MGSETFLVCRKIKDFTGYKVNIEARFIFPQIDLRDFLFNRQICLKFDLITYKITKYFINT